MSIAPQELACLCGLEASGGDPSCRIDSASNIDEAGPNQIAFIGTAKRVEQLGTTRAGAVIVPRSLGLSGRSSGPCLIQSDDCEMTFIRCLEILYPRARPSGVIHASAAVDASASIGEGCELGAFVSVGRNSNIGRNCRLLSGCHVGQDVVIGEDCVLHPGVILYDGTKLGDRVEIHAGTVIGADGYGYKYRDGVHVKFPQVGTVEIGDDVEIGSNSCVDRAALGTTTIGAGTKIDNQVHIAHNVKVGRGVLILGQTGIGGSSHIEDYAILASQCGIADHVRIGAGAKVLAQSGVIGDVGKGQEVVGFPAAKRKDALREMATLRRLAASYPALKELLDLLPRLRSITVSGTVSGDGENGS